MSVNPVNNPAPLITNVSATTGSVGSQVVINGLGFGTSQNGSLVTLNNAAVTINSWTATSITVTIPTGATSGALLVSLAPSMNDSNPIQSHVTTNPLPTTWLDQDVGTVGVMGNATYSNGVFSVQGAGTGMGSSVTSDQIHFVYQPMSGNGTIVARVVSLQGSGSPTAGIMIRQTLAANDMFASGYDGAGYAGIYYGYRTSTGGYASESYPKATSLPYWIMVQRSGSTFTSYIAPDGVNWIQLGSAETINMAQNVYVGLIVESGNNTALATATFDSVSINSDLSVSPSISGVSATTASVGNQVTIYGSEFGSTQGSSQVLINGLPATINAWSATSITITVPTGATSGPLEVLQGPTMNSSNPIDFTVTTQPLPGGWLDQDIGAVGLAGSSSYSNGVFTINGAGAG